MKKIGFYPIIFFIFFLAILAISIFSKDKRPTPVEEALFGAKVEQLKNAKMGTLIVFNWGEIADITLDGSQSRGMIQYESIGYNSQPIEADLLALTVKKIITEKDGEEYIKALKLFVKFQRYEF